MHTENTIISGFTSPSFHSSFIQMLASTVDTSSETLLSLQMQKIRALDAKGAAHMSNTTSDGHKGNHEDGSKESPIHHMSVYYLRNFGASL